MIPASPSYPPAHHIPTPLYVAPAIKQLPQFWPGEVRIEVIWTDTVQEKDFSWKPGPSSRLLFLLVYPRGPVVCSPRRRP